MLLHNEGGNKNNWLRLSFKGLADNNKSAIGTKVEVFAEGIVRNLKLLDPPDIWDRTPPISSSDLGEPKKQTWSVCSWPPASCRTRSRSPGFEQRARFTWKSIAAAVPVPGFLAWDGFHYQLDGDMLGAGVVGHWVGPDWRNIARAYQEYIKLTAKRNRRERRQT